MKQKVVIRVLNCDKKYRSKALQIAVGVPGVESAALQGENKNQIAVTGDGVDVVKLTTLLRKKLGLAELISLTQIKEDEKTEDTESKPVVWPTYQAAAMPQPYFCVYHPSYYNHGWFCS